MAWNHPREEGRANTSFSPRRGRGTRPTIVHGLIGAAVVILGAAVALFVLSSSERTRQDAASTQPKLIKAETPATVKKPLVAEPAAPKLIDPKADPNYRPSRPGEIANGYRVLADGTLRKIHGIITNSPARISLAEKTFDKTSDQMIGNLLLVEPGTHFLGDSSQYYHDFAEEFRESLKTPIVIGKDDDEDTKWIKGEVIEIRKELKSRMDRGEDIGQVMRESREQLREISLYKDDIEKMVRTHGMNLDNQKDYEDLVGAANLMLKERGSPPLSLPSTLKSALRSWRADISDHSTKENTP